KPYHDTVGVLTVGYGHNLEEATITAELAEAWLKDDIEAATRDLVSAFPIVLELSEVRQRVLINMTFNMGINRLKGYKKMWRALEQNDYFAAANEMEDSKWHRQVGKRAEE
ncbi:MAG: glycoside hydrolase family protein, partial [Gammaproteobacteria bacterium]|nr:glycoside hydrolase family protein [Gammaproteobacteria bacterium]